jgi:hypothetical protein
VYIIYGKEIPINVWRASFGFRMLSFPEFLENRHKKMARFSALPLRRYPWYSFVLEVESTPGP